MANVFGKGNVWVVDTDGALPLTGKVRVKGVILKSDGTNTASLSLKTGGTSGTTIFSTAVLANTAVPASHEIEFTAEELAADIGGTGAVAYVYLA